MVISIDTIRQTRIVATYERVSSEDQRERDTIRTQQEELAKRLGSDSTASVFKRYSDNGVSGSVPVAQRPGGKQLLRDAENHLFDEVWIYNLKRLGRDKIDLLILKRRFEDLNIKIISLQEGELTGIGFDINAIMTDWDKRFFLKLSYDGLNRAAREGRYTGGIVPLGFKVVGVKQNAHLELCEEPMWAGISEADVVRRIYNRLSVDGWSCVRIAKELNDLGVPTDYIHDKREILKGERKIRTQGVWRPGRIRNMVVNPIYKGVIEYGRRTDRPGGREIISKEVPSIALVPKEIWDAAQETLHRNRVIGPATNRVYLLKSVIRCGICGLSYVSCLNRNSVWYRCNGHLTGRGPTEGRCTGKDIKGDYLEPQVWSDIEGFLRNPGEILAELKQERENDSAAAIQEAERITLEEALQQIARRRTNAIDLRTRERITNDELDAILADVEKEKLKLEERLQTLKPEIEKNEAEPISTDMLSEIRKRLDAGLTPQQKQEIARLLIKRITIYTEGDGKIRKARAVVEYRFPQSVAVPTSTDMGSLPRPIESWPDR